MAKRSLVTSPNTFFHQSLGQSRNSKFGKRFEEGAYLSAKKWQIALARAFCRATQIIVVDKHTSAMDPKTKHNLWHRFYFLT